MLVILLCVLIIIIIIIVITEVYNAMLKEDLADITKLYADGEIAARKVNNSNYGIKGIIILIVL